MRPLFLFGSYFKLDLLCHPYNLNLYFNYLHLNQLFNL